MGVLVTIPFPAVTDFKFSKFSVKSLRDFGSDGDFGEGDLGDFGDKIGGGSSSEINLDGARLFLFSGVTRFDR